MRRTASYRRAVLPIETLEKRTVFNADFSPLEPALAHEHEHSHEHALERVHPVFAPETSADVIAAYEDLEHTEGFDLFSFVDADRWTRTASHATSLTQGDATTIRWSITPDGTPIAGFNGEAAAPSNLRSFLAGIYGSNASSSRAQDQPWFNIVKSVFDRWSAVSGVTYVYEANDDGAAISAAASGVIGVRGDVRLGGHRIDGPGNVLAYNFYPTVGDMIIDTSDTFFTNTASNSLRLRNTLAHELGHGLGLGHVLPANGTKLMEPTISLNFDGPQADDILAINRGYGDRLEKNGGNNTSGTATRLSVTNSFSIDTLSIDDNTDVDWFQFTVNAGSRLSLTLSPTGSTYASGSVIFNAMAQSDLTLAVYGNGGSTLIAQANTRGAGFAETLSNLAISSTGTYYVRVSGSANAAQMYRLSGEVTRTQTTVAAPEIAILDGSINLTDNVSSVNFGTVALGAAATKTFTVRNTGSATLSLGSNITLPAGFTLARGLGTTQLAPGASTTFVVRMTTSTARSLSGVVSLTSNDSDESLFTFTLRGTVGASTTTPVNTAAKPEIAILNGSTNLTHNSSSVTYGNVTRGTSVVKTFTVRNIGTANLSLGALQLPAGFTLTKGLGVSTLGPGSSTTFTVAMNTSTAGTYSGKITLANNDADESRFQFTVTGTVVATTATSTTPTGPFSDNFNRASSTVLGSNWTERSGNLSISNSTLVNSVSGKSAATVNNVTYSDVVLNANVNLGTSGTTRDMGLVARRSADGSQYWAGLTYSGGRYYAQIWEVNGATWTRLSSAAIASGSASLRFEVIGSSLKLYVNGKLTNSAIDTTLKSGQIGVAATGLGVSVDNFAVAQTTALTTPPAYSAQWLAALDQLATGWGQSNEQKQAIGW